jgi:hypothetical protein
MMDLEKEDGLETISGEEGSWEQCFVLDLQHSSL